MVEGVVARWAEAVMSFGNASDRGDLGSDLRSREHAAHTRLGALAQLQLDRANRVRGDHLFELVQAELAGCVAAAEVSGADLPDQITVTATMGRANGAFPCVVSKLPCLGASVESFDGITAERTEAHRRDIQ